MSNVLFARNRSFSQCSLIILLIIGVALSGCESTTMPVAVKDIGSKHDRRVKTHVVAPGETLYSIAWRYDLNFKKLALANGIDSQYRIVPGQKLRLNLDQLPHAVPKRSSTAAKHIRPSNVISKSKPAPRSVKESRPKNNQRALLAAPTQLDWFWPTDGRLTKKFYADKGRHKGIDLDGKVGQPVLATSSGVVVYAGSGLRGYGKLIIIKHNEKFLSAYAHNRKLLVSEGDKVSARQKIAEMGSSGTDSVKLHFEVRFDGRPVDPLKYVSPAKR